MRITVERTTKRFDEDGADVFRPPARNSSDKVQICHNRTKSEVSNGLDVAVDPRDSVDLPCRYQRKLCQRRVGLDATTPRRRSRPDQPLDHTAQQRSTMKVNSPDGSADRPIGTTITPPSAAMLSSRAQCSGTCSTW